LRNRSNPEKLDELFTFHVCEVEGTEQLKDEKGKVTDTIFDLKSFLTARIMRCVTGV